MPRTTEVQFHRDSTRSPQARSRGFDYSLAAIDARWPTSAACPASSVHSTGRRAQVSRSVPAKVQFQVVTLEEVLRPRPTDPAAINQVPPDRSLSRIPTGRTPLAPGVGRTGTWPTPPGIHYIYDYSQLLSLQQRASEAAWERLRETIRDAVHAALANPDRPGTSEAPLLDGATPSAAQSTIRITCDPTSMPSDQPIEDLPSSVNSTSLVQRTFDALGESKPDRLVQLRRTELVGLGEIEKRLADRGDERGVRDLAEMLELADRWRTERPHPAVKQRRGPRDNDPLGMYDDRIITISHALPAWDDGDVQQCRGRLRETLRVLLPPLPTPSPSEQPEGSVPAKTVVPSDVRISYHDVIDGRPDLGLPRTPKTTYRTWCRDPQAAADLDVNPRGKVAAQQPLLSGLLRMHGQKAANRRPPGRKQK